MPFLDHANHAYPSFTSRLAKSLKFSRLSHLGPRDMFIHCLVCRNMPGQCLDHVGAMFSLYFLSISLEFSKLLRLSQLGIKDMFLEYLNFGTMPRPYFDHVMATAKAMFDHVRAIYSLALHPE